MILKFSTRELTKRSVLCKHYSSHAHSNIHHNYHNTHKSKSHIDLKAYWYYATDTPISKSNHQSWKPTTAAEKFVPFPKEDSARLEAVYQYLIRNGKNVHHNQITDIPESLESDETSKSKHPKIEEVSVLEDKLYEVNISKRTLYPIYWDGPTFEVRRGTWFIRDNSKNDPIPEPLAYEIEALYQYSCQKLLFPSSDQSASKPKSPLTKAIEAAIVSEEKTPSMLKDFIGPKGFDIFALTTSVDQNNLVKAISQIYYPKQKDTISVFPEPDPSNSSFEPGSSTSSVIDFFTKPSASSSNNKRYFVSFDLQKPNTNESKDDIQPHNEVAAYVYSGDLSAILARKFISFGGTKCVRGYAPLNTSSAASAANTLKALLADNDVPSEYSDENSTHYTQETTLPPSKVNPSTNKSTDTPLVSVSSSGSQNRSIDHLVLCIHGIGQKLSDRIEHVNFVNDINIFRMLLKKVFLESSHLQKDAAEYILNKYDQSVEAMKKTIEKENKQRSIFLQRQEQDQHSLNHNHGKLQLIPKKRPLARAMESAKKLLEGQDTDERLDKEKLKKGTKIADHRVQVIPLIWRHNIQFGLTRQEVDGTDSSDGKKKKDVDGENASETVRDGENYMGSANQVSLEDINVNGILPLRNIVGDVVLDVLLYYQPQYHQQIFNVVVKQLNKVYHEFCKRNPVFAKNPQVSIIGHSLGSAIAFDIVCAQNQRKKLESLEKDNGKSETKETNTQQQEKLDFDVDIFFGVGSPVGMFQLLKGNKIVSSEELLEGVEKNHESKSKSRISGPFELSSMNLLSHFNNITSRNKSESSENSETLGYVSPGVRAYYNIFHPSDPVAYRVDPLVDRDAASLPAKKVPYIQGSLPSQIQKFQDLATKFSREATSLWSNMSSTLLEKSSFEDNSFSKGGLSELLAFGKQDKAKKEISNGDIIKQNHQNKDVNNSGSKVNVGVSAAIPTTSKSENDDNSSISDPSLAISKRFPFADLPKDKQQRVLQKLARFNHTGQIDYALQEGVLDISLFAALASHVTYFENADLASFVLKAIYEVRGKTGDGFNKSEPKDSK